MNIVHELQITPPRTPTFSGRRAGTSSQPHQAQSTTSGPVTPRRSPNMLLRELTPAKHRRPASPEHMTTELALDLLQLTKLDGSIEQLEYAYRITSEQAASNSGHSYTGNNNFGLPFVSSSGSQIRLIERAFQYLCMATRNSNDCSSNNTGPFSPSSMRMGRRNGVLYELTPRPSVMQQNPTQHEN